MLGHAVVIGGATLLGGVLGAGLRVLLASMRRGACAPRGACEVGVALAAGVPAAAGALGGVGAAWVPVWVGVGVLAVAVSVTDLAHRRIPDALTGPALAGLTALVVPLGTGAVAAGFAGALLFLGAHAAVHLLSPRSLGGGDVKLAGALAVPVAAGSWAAGSPAALAASPVLTAVAAVLVAALTRSRTVALGPPAGAVAWVLVAGLALATP